jgi:hypothetical protein
MVGKMAGSNMRRLPIELRYADWLLFAHLVLKHNKLCGYWLHNTIRELLTEALNINPKEFERMSPGIEIFVIENVAERRGRVMQRWFEGDPRWYRKDPGPLKLLNILK